jgi:hypothetical protein
MIWAELFGLLACMPAKNKIRRFPDFKGFNGTARSTQLTAGPTYNSDRLLPDIVFWPLIAFFCPSRVYRRILDTGYHPIPL